MNKSRLLFRGGGATAYLGGCHCLSGVWWFPSALIIRLSQPRAGDWLAGAWAELGKKLSESGFFSRPESEWAKPNK